MKKIFGSIICLSLVAGVFAQQEEQYTQFMHYKLGFNPAYAGSDGASVAALVRSQWLGIDGAPQTQLLTFDLPMVNNRVGIGGNINRQTIGLTENYTAEAVYAYRFRFVRGYLSAGLSTSVRLFRVNFNDAEAIQPISSDGAIPGDIQSKYIPNFGAGLYYNNDWFYLGFSCPRLLESNISLASLDGVISREVRHFYLMGGARFGDPEGIQVQPQVLLKYVGGAPFDADVNVNLAFMKKFYTGVSYRIGGSKRSGIGESVSLLLGTQITKNMLFSVSYDTTLSELRDYNSGSVEGVLRFFLRKPEGEDFDPGVPERPFY